MGSFLSTAKDATKGPHENDLQKASTSKRRRLSATGASSDDITKPRAAKRARTEHSVYSTADGKKKVHVRRRKRKVALLLGYIGERYFGMQLNVGVLTIEKVLLDALHQAGAISDENKNSLGKVNWMRAARTDKGVSAACQCVSAKIECEVNGDIDPTLPDLINKFLPHDVHLYGVLRATSAFNARSDCHRRRYEYIFPVRLLGGKNAIETAKGDGMGDPRVAKMNEILSAYVGTHCFANFTEGLTSSDDSARRFMIEVKCGEPFLPAGSGVYYVAICIFGQSFVLHQIRKMVGLAFFVYLDRAPRAVIPVALSPHVRLPTPTAPSLGLLLDELHFDQYNARHKMLPIPISINAFANEKLEFKMTKIYARIAEKERLNRTMENWIRSSSNRQKYDAVKIHQLHENFVLSDNGLEEQRKTRIASLYPIVTTMEDFANPEGSGCEADTFRLANSMRVEFETRFGTPASFLIRAPGRVNLIGEHLDYNDFPVIGMAIKQSTLIAGCLDDTTTNIAVEHFESKAYVKGSLHADGARLADSASVEDDEDVVDSRWLTYVSCGHKAMVSSLHLNRRTEPNGGKILVGGNLPRAFGLASSSSLVTAAALSAARLNRKRLPKHTITEIAANGEKLGLGTHGGAVDHALCMGGVNNSALFVSFNPKPDTTPLKLPKNGVFVIVNSRVIAQKGATGGVKADYNTRVAECKVASAILARRLGTISPNVVQTPGQLLQMAIRTKDLKVESLHDLQMRVSEVMEADEKMTIKDVFANMKIREAEVKSRFLDHLELEELQLGKRMSHVLSEAARVEKFKALVELDTTSDAVVELIGELLNQSHKSLREEYECSCDEVDAVVAFCRESGASGSRIIGAGWGGCVLSLVHTSKVETFVHATRQRYGDAAVFVVSPAAGASVFAIHSSYNSPRVNPQA